MTIGLHFPVTGLEDRDHVPWNLVEAHRAEVQRKFGQTLERLAATGGLPIEDLAPYIGWSKGGEKR